MSVIIDFNEEEKNQLLKSIKKEEYLLKYGHGSQGICYLINGNVYKVFHCGWCRTNNTICKDDLNLKSFLFPNEIYIHDQGVFACKTDTYIENNQISVHNLDDGKFPDINSIRKALVPLIEDIYTLSENHIRAIDLAWRNLLFDGKSFFIIDTLNYIEENEVDRNIIYEANIIDLKKDCIYPFIEAYSGRYRRYSTIDKQYTDYEKIRKKLFKLIPYFDKLAKKIQEEYKDKEVQKIKDH